MTKIFRDLKLLALGVLFCLLPGLSVASDMSLFPMEGIDPVTFTWIGGDALGSQVHSVTTAVSHSGSQSLVWEYTLGATAASNWPTIEMQVPSVLSNWTGATGLSAWMYFDLTGTKYNWTLEPAIMHPYPTGDTLGNWNSDPGGVPAATWTNHVWDLSSISSISSVSHLRMNYHAGDGWEALAQPGGVIRIMLDDLEVLGVNLSDENNLFDMEGTNPFTNMWIGGDGAGVQSTAISTSIAHLGSQSALMRYELPADPAGDFPTFEMAIPAGKNDWTGASVLSAWMYFDTTNNKDFWTIQPNIQHPWPTGTDLGNWNVGPNPGIPPATWVQHSWSLTSAGDISNVSHLRWFYHAGDGWAGVAKPGGTNGIVDIYLDDIGVDVTFLDIDAWELY